MLRYELGEKIDQQERKEYDYCTGTMLKALKSLRFDVIKNKGTPISEDVYLEIWVEDNGKIENWTNLPRVTFRYSLIFTVSLYTSNEFVSHASIVRSLPSCDKSIKWSLKEFNICNSCANNPALR